MNSPVSVFDLLWSQLQPQDIRRELARHATERTAEYVRTHMRTVQSVATLASVHDVAIDAVTIPDGLVMEFGVFSGNVINYIASKRDWIVHGFDSFEGLPEAWRDGFDKGHFKLGALPDVRENVRLHKGWFADSIPLFREALESASRPIAYMHIDCDLYSSTKTIFCNFKENLVSGTVIVFDEYFNYDGWEHGEFKAFQEFIAETGRTYDYLTYNRMHEQVAVILR